jgi:HlyD family secretion protein
LKLAKDDLSRYVDLRSQEVISQQKFDTSQTQYNTAINTQQEAVAQVRTAEAHLNLLLAGPRIEEIAQARARVVATEQTLSLARQELNDTQLKAPSPGVVLSKAAEPGSYLAPGTPVITVGNIDRVWLRGYINETDLARIRINQAVSVKTDTYPDKIYSGKITLSLVSLLSC